MDEVQERLRRYYETEMADRLRRPLGKHREAVLADVAEHCRAAGVRSILEVGCGAGRDGTALAATGAAYCGVDVTAAAVALCRDLGLSAVEGSALDLPFADDSFDAAWTMSTLMHLPGDGMQRALKEIRRVVRAGGLLQLGVWGAYDDRERVDEHGRYFWSRSDGELCRLAIP